jgi:hypothetical protein
MSVSPVKSKKLTNRVRRKRSKAVLAIVAAVVGTGIVTSCPRSDLEIAKQAFITIANVAMCTMVWDIYFDEELSKKTLPTILSELCFMTLSSMFTAYILAKGITAAMHYFIQSGMPMGWGLSGLLAGLATGLLGMGWTFYCDDWYHNAKP